MIALKYPKAQAFLDAHPDMDIDTAIEYLDRKLHQGDKVL